MKTYVTKEGFGQALKSGIRCIIIQESYDGKDVAIMTGIDNGSSVWHGKKTDLSEEVPS